MNKYWPLLLIIMLLGIYVATIGFINLLSDDMLAENGLALKNLFRLDHWLLAMIVMLCGFMSCIFAGKAIDKK